MNRKLLQTILIASPLFFATHASADEPPRARFTADPVGDGATVAVALTFGILSNQVLSTDEIRPQQISATFKSTDLLWIDRPAVKQTPLSAANALSNIGLGLTFGYAALDTALDLFREGKSAALVDAIMYTEALLLTQGLTNVAKIAFRRPRPRAYIARDEYIRTGGDPLTYDNSDVDSALSFFSGHASQTAAMSAAATYISFVRSPNTVRPWLTLVAGGTLTSMVGYTRVRAGAHFPTDVIGGALAGTAVGALIVHLHRDDASSPRKVWVGFSPTYEGGVLTASGLF